MEKFDLKLIGGQLVIDMGQTADDRFKHIGYNGQPAIYDFDEICVPIIGTVELSDEQIKKIGLAYTNGDKCDYCEEYTDKVRPSPFMADAGASMCKECWDGTKEEYATSTDEHIGDFEDYPHWKEGAE
ncbi:hypothetical protein P4T89_12820 [Bacillus nakamurai]|uniref:Uncharacterized protein n=1 Tax=Bacillus nakamurai TaxID=1793963 RepID=A0A150FAP2_9BACI|nr:hypothetical protein [Bacillus nakamurai]KXZ22379.1 hypothetical protein AXI58_10335 [Bacillus nakamurai]MED1228398.1 hypothetical protein [Bacillus nakamurai]